MATTNISLEKTPHEEWGITDIGELLFMFFVSKERNIPIPKKNLDSLVYSLKQNEELQFFYSFHLNPLPVSNSLRDDLRDLVATSEIEISSPIKLTSKGENWVESYLIDQPRFEEVCDSVGNSLERRKDWTEEDYFKHIYEHISR